MHASGLIASNPKAPDRAPRRRSYQRRKPCHMGLYNLRQGIRGKYAAAASCWHFWQSAPRTTQRLISCRVAPLAASLDSNPWRFQLQGIGLGLFRLQLEGIKGDKLLNCWLLWLLFCQLCLESIHWMECSKVVFIDEHLLLHRRKLNCHRVPESVGWARSWPMNHTAS